MDGWDEWMKRVDSSFLWAESRVVGCVKDHKKNERELKRKRRNQSKTERNPDLKKKEKKSCDNNIFYDCVIDDDYSCYLSDRYYQ